MLISGEPGTGKTELIAKRVAHLIEKENLPPKAILILSFTRNSVTELKERIKTELRNLTEIYYRLKIMTFDRFASKILQDDRDYRVFEHNFETNICNAVNFIQDYDSRSEEFKTFFRSIKYVIVDEIQDLYYGRAVLLQSIFSTLDEIQDKWGYILLLDECQEIFSYMEKKGAKSPFEGIFKRSKEFIDWVIKWTERKYPEDFINEPLDLPISENKRYKCIENKKLLAIMANARFILKKYPNDIEKLKSIKNRFPKNTLEKEKELFELLRKNTNENKTTCILFRGNKKATNCSLKLFQQDPPILHTYQLSNQSRVYPNWIAYSVNNAIADDMDLSDDVYIKKEIYLENWNSTNLMQKFNLNSENAWNFLNFMATESEETDLIYLDELKSGLTRNYSDMVLTEYGYNAAPIIISNIHKSKGREYDYVFLEDGVLPKNKMFDLDTVQLHARINYVALTRCQRNFQLISTRYQSFYNYRVSDEFNNLGPCIDIIEEEDTEKIIYNTSFLSSDDIISQEKQDKIWDLQVGKPIQVKLTVNPPNRYAKVYTLEQNPDYEDELCVLSESFTKKLINKINRFIVNSNRSKKKIRKQTNNTYTLVGARIVSLNTELLPLDVREYSQISDLIPLKYFRIGYWLGFRIMGPLYINN